MALNRNADVKLRIRIGLKYCGGCNPGYDRVDLVQQIEENLLGKAEFVSSGGEDVDLILAVQGCSTACADLSDFRGTEIWIVTKIEDADKFVQEISERVTIQSNPSTHEPPPNQQNGSLPGFPG